MADLVLSANSSPANATWTASGTTPYIDATDASYVTTSTKNVVTEIFTFEESADLGTITSVIFSIRANSDDGKGDITIEYSPDNGSNFPASDSHINFTAAYETRNSVELITTFDTWAKINLAAARFIGTASSTYQVDHVYITVVYTAAALAVDAEDVTSQSTISEPTIVDFTFVNADDVTSQSTISEPSIDGVRLVDAEDVTSQPTIGVPTINIVGAVEFVTDADFEFVDDEDFIFMPATVGGVAPTSVIYGPLMGPLGGPI